MDVQPYFFRLKSPFIVKGYFDLGKKDQIGGGVGFVFLQPFIIEGQKKEAQRIIVSYLNICSFFALHNRESSEKSKILVKFSI